MGAVHPIVHTQFICCYKRFVLFPLIALFPKTNTPDKLLDLSKKFLFFTFRKFVILFLLLQIFV